MRDIIFRGKRVDNGEWVEGCLAIWGPTSARQFSIMPLPVSPGITLYNYLVDPETVGEFSGLPDKNGSRVFEGDIVRTHYANAVKADFVETVVFHNGKFCAESLGSWAPLADGIKHVVFDKSVYMESCEVIGNIFDNPTLLDTHTA
jgi:uncharacterized phage protein (TIGR01671 family)